MLIEAVHAAEGCGGEVDGGGDGFVASLGGGCVGVEEPSI